MAFRITITNALRIDADEAGLQQLEEIKQALTIPNPAHIQATRFGRRAWGIPPYLAFYRKFGSALIAPRGFIGKLSTMTGMMNPIVEDLRRLCQPVTFSFSGELRPYQQEAIASIIKRDQGVLQAGTGAGKTVMALAIIAERKQPSLILVHNKELLVQWANRAKQFLGIEPGRIGAGMFEVRPLTIGIVNSVRNRLDDLHQHFGHVVVDECHRCPSSMFTECVDAFDAHFRLGLSATPYRRDGLTKVIHYFLGPKIHEVNQGRLQLLGAILQPEVLTRQTDFRFAKDGTDHYQELLTALTQDQGRNAFIADDVKRELTREAGTCLIVSDRVAHLEALSACLNALGLKMELLTGQTPKGQREAIAGRVREGAVQVLGSTIQLIGEGFDCPGLSSLFLATPIRSQGRLLQVVGRILRPKDGKTPRVYDYQDPVGVLRGSASARAIVYERQGFSRQVDMKKRGARTCV